jgi:hypothetical protein
MPNWLRHQLIAAAASLVIALVLHAYDCYAGTHEACMISRGLLWMYWFGIYVILGAPLALAARGRTRIRQS